MQPGKVARSGEEKAGNVPAPRLRSTDRKSFKKIDCDEKNRPGMAAMQLLHCTILTFALYV
ncbi:hypothetical protein EN742_22575 [Mesorhizobium sp. M4A.F.Ca.ET.020.02.1.1]|uniref:hypothetical protein n=1 Tax=unclassified Mesorhizobium TaxID=325217 RepID=UPI000FCA83C3|nr:MULTISPECIES: hypothetical protein [unclassified Mesorhizobium]RVD70730.1 hypothetical protein EN751_19155 [Mesorhizobium sp. M4A.F.Ca.ET.029.04.2.1]RUX44511.1 hypothetical protein EOA33_26545 [Mesorhizobium sp. M4A.F.Ca.ET.050.02.1.1]RVC77843.1 hypothetical protein EN745_20695 [Mesorhizobium sp. M4A.F.Ca.ET.022.05.2.1]RVD36434.1 hypothetical protein EN742_22575 [Mesorhizobium sp. M4A.F.Ca.ET.020.02.1.1]RWC19374.1 MAG: hypothetical protein EOS53_13460 [Mesorhizobium sp.]